MIPEAKPDRPFFFMFRWGAASNLGILYQESGDQQSAIRYLSSVNPTGQGYGNLLTATANVWSDPFADLPLALPNPPEDTFTPNTAIDPPATAGLVPQAPAQSQNRPLPGLGGAPLQLRANGGAIGLPNSGPRPVGPGGAAGLLPQGFGNSRDQLTG